MHFDWGSKAEGRSWKEFVQMHILLFIVRIYL